MDFDPRDYDSRDEERFTSRDNSSHDFDRDDDLRLPDDRGRDRDDDARELGRGPGDSRQSNHDGQDSRDDARWPEHERNYDPREAFTRDLNLPRGHEREIVRDRDRDTPCAARRRAPSQPSALSEWSPVVIFETTTTVRRSAIRRPATSARTG